METYTFLKCRQDNKWYSLKKFDFSNKTKKGDGGSIIHSNTCLLSSWSVTIAFISTSFEIFLVKFVIVLAFFQKKEKRKKAYYKIKGINFCYKKIMILNIC